MTDEPVFRPGWSLLRVGRAFGLLWECAPAELLASQVLWIVNSLLPLATLVVLRRLVDAAGHAGGSERFHAMLPLVGLLGGVALLANWSQALTNLVDESEAGKAADHVADVLHGQSLELDLDFFDRARFHRLLYRAQQEAPYRPPRIVRGLGRLVQNGLGLAWVGAVLLSLHWLVLASLAAAALPGLLLRLKSARALASWQRANVEDERRTAYYHGVLTEEASAKEVRLYGLGTLFRGWFRDLRARLRRERLELIRRRVLADLATQTLAWAAVLGSLAFVARDVMRGKGTAGDLVFYYLAIQRGFSYFQDLTVGLGGLSEDLSFLESYDEFLALRTKVTDPPRPLEVPRPIREGFALDRVSFRYPQSERVALEDVSLAIPPGQVVALVGENGAGKSTVVKLLCRLYDPSTGRVTLDGTTLDQFALRPLRGLIAAMFQDFGRYDLTLRQNVWLGDVDLLADDPAIDEAGRLAGANAVAAGLIERDQTRLGHWQEEGTELSGGQWQRVALARALVRKAPLLILDEPTSGMDVEAEGQFYEGLRRGLTGRSVLLISHRFAAICQADVIYLMARGRVIEQGTHADLVRLGGEYARLFRLQSKPFKDNVTEEA